VKAWRGAEENITNLLKEISILGLDFSLVTDEQIGGYVQPCVYEHVKTYAYGKTVHVHRSYTRGLNTEFNENGQK
jgi:hypothetical protein